MSGHKIWRSGVFVAFFVVLLANVVVDAGKRVDKTTSKKEPLSRPSRAVDGEGPEAPGAQLGRPGVDYPAHSYVPHTLFTCHDMPKPGIYADIYAECQVYHICDGWKTGRRGPAFLCPVGTVFNQQKLVCDWWYNVDCYQSPKYFDKGGDDDDDKLPASNDSKLNDQH